MKEYFKELISIIDKEGLHNTFKNYSDFNRIEDTEFHKLRKYYLQYANLLENYIKVNSK